MFDYCIYEASIGRVIHELADFCGHNLNLFEGHFVFTESQGAICVNSKGRKGKFSDLGYVKYMTELNIYIYMHIYREGERGSL